MNSDRPAFLGQTDNVLLNLFASGHHQIGDFVGDDHDEWQAFGHVLCLATCGGQPLLKFFFAQLVVASDMANTGLSQECVTLFHFIDGPGQDGFGFTHVGDDGVHQVR